MNYRYFSSESVSNGHPDKVCDQISDAILDAILAKDPKARVAVDCMVKSKSLIIMGEITTNADVDFDQVARQKIKDIGYLDNTTEFHSNCEIQLLLTKQSAEIGGGVDQGGAGDQGMMFGYACNETPQLMPLPIMISHALAQGMDQARQNQAIPYLRPDGKTETVVKYDYNHPSSIERIVIAVPHAPGITQAQLTADLQKQVIEPVLNNHQISSKHAQIVVNGAGPWVIHGPTADSGMTGRKTIVDTYGAMGRHGGGAFSGKDPTKVDRSAAYAARFIAKNVVAKGLADRCEVQIAYVIGQKEPITKSIETFGTAKISSWELEKFAFDLLDLSVHEIIDYFDLRQPIYTQTACYGHFGRTEFPWERLISQNQRINIMSGQATA